jgi:hypothetical protein
MRLRSIASVNEFGFQRTYCQNFSGFGSKSCFTPNPGLKEETETEAKDEMSLEFILN